MQNGPEKLAHDVDEQRHGSSSTCRLDRTNDGVYEVTRVLDDAQAGAFVLGPPIRLPRGALSVNLRLAPEHGFRSIAKETASPS